MKKTGQNDGNSTIPGIIFWPYIGILVLVIPNVTFPGIADPVQPVRLLIQGLTTFGIILFLLLRNKISWNGILFYKDWVFRFFMLYILLVVISLFFAGLPTEGFFDLAKTVLSFITLVVISYMLLQDVSKVSTLTKMIILAALIFSLTGLVQYGMYVAGRSGKDMYAGLYLVKGFSGHKVAYSTMLFLTLPFVTYGLYRFTRVWKLLAFTAAFLVLFMIFISQTRAVWIGVCVALATAALFGAFYRFRSGEALFARKLRLILYPVLAVLLLGISYFTFSPGFRKVVSYQVGGMTNAYRSTNMPRISILDATRTMYLDHPLTGVGAGNWKIQIPAYQYDYEFYMMDEYKPEVRFQTWLRPHNDFIWVLAEKGPLGFLAFLGIFLFFVMAGSRSVFKLHGKDHLLLILLLGTILGYMVISLVGFPLERVDNQVYLIILMGVGLTLIYAPQSKRRDSGPLLRKYFLYPALILSALTLVYSIFLFKLEIDLASFLTIKKSGKESARNEQTLRTDASLVPLDAFANPVYYYLGIHELRENNPVGAMVFFHDAHRDHPYNINLLYSLSSACLKKGDIAGSIQYSNELLRIFPFHPEGLMNLAVAFFMEGRYDRSLQTLLTIKERDPFVNQAIRKTVSRLDRQNAQ